MTHSRSMKDKIGKLLREKEKEIAILKTKVGILDDQIVLLELIYQRWETELSDVERQNAKNTLRELFGL